MVVTQRVGDFHDFGADPHMLDSQQHKSPEQKIGNYCVPTETLSTIGFPPNPTAKCPTTIVSPWCFPCRPPATTPCLDSRFTCPAVNATLVPQRRAAFLTRTVWRFPGFGYPPMSANVAFGDPHCLPCHATIISYSAQRT